MRGCRASRKIIDFGVFKCDDSVYTEIVTNRRKTTLQAIIRGRVSANAIILGWLRGYDGLVDVGYSKRYRGNHGDLECANSQSHIDGIESFWSYAKCRLQKFN
jgi:transposase